MLEAKNGLPGFLRLLETGQEDCIVIARHNKPVAKLVPIERIEEPLHIGAARGKILYREGWDSSEINDEISALFGTDL